jgi:hypothetical protein
MRPTRVIAFIFTLITSALLMGGSAFADTVSMHFIGPAGNNSGGVYTYPYNFSINGGPSTALLCDAFNNEIASGETWTATTTFIPGGSGLFGSTSSPNYEAAGLIFDAILNINGGLLNGTVSNTNDANWAIWALNSSTALADISGPGPFGAGGDPTALSIYNAALGAVNAPGFHPGNYFNGIVIYTPVAGTQSGQPGNNTPQEFIGYTPVPEPSQLSLMGVLAVVGFSGFAFRKRLAPKFAVNFQQ